MIRHLPTAKLGILTALFFTLIPFFGHAQEGQVLSVTPPLFQLSVKPGELWQSSIKVVNGNSHELVVYAEVVNFAAQGERGQGKFIPIPEADDTGRTLAQWIEINRGPHIIPPERTKDITFFVEVPDDAPPGGHFAAILVGTQPPEGDGPFLVQTSQAVTSLFFLRVEGDVVESGTIREFSMDDSFLEEPSAEFVLRFENKGNVHLQPRGEIRITNMWGSERGIIPINNQSHFGNVLPESIREFRFTWKGEKSITELGRYTAVATLAYGESGSKNIDATTYFWVIPIKATLITLGALIAFILFIAWAIKLYVRRMLSLAGVDVETLKQRTDSRSADVRLTSYQTVSAPLKSGALDLRSRLRNGRQLSDLAKILMQFILSYKTFFISVVVMLVGLAGLIYYIHDASKDQRSYEVTIERVDGTTVVDSEEILREKIKSRETTVASSSEQHFRLEIVNASGEAGLAAETAVMLEDKGYLVSSVSTSDAGERKQSVILYGGEVPNDAVTLSSLLGNILLSALPVETAGSAEEVPVIRILLGSDRIK